MRTAGGLAAPDISFTVRKLHLGGPQQRCNLRLQCPPVSDHPILKYFVTKRFLLFDIDVYYKVTARVCSLCAIAQHNPGAGEIWTLTGLCTYPTQCVGPDVKTVSELFLLLSGGLDATRKLFSPS